MIKNTSFRPLPSFKSGMIWKGGEMSFDEIIIENTHCRYSEEHRSEKITIIFR